MCIICEICDKCFTSSLTPSIYMYIVFVHTCMIFFSVILQLNDIYQSQYRLSIVGHLDAFLSKKRSKGSLNLAFWNIKYILTRIVLYLFFDFK